MSVEHSLVRDRTSPLLGADPGCCFVPSGLRFVHLRSRESLSQLPTQQTQINTLIRKGHLGGVVGFLLRLELIWEELYHISI